MKTNWKVILLVIVLCVCVLVFSGCEHKSGNRILEGKDVQTFTYAYIYLGNQEIVKGYITQWRDYKDCEEVQLLIGGKYYLTSYNNVVMIADPEQGALNYSDPDLMHGVSE